MVLRGRKIDNDDEISYCFFDCNWSRKIGFKTKITSYIRMVISGHDFRSTCYWIDKSIFIRFSGLWKNY